MTGRRTFAQTAMDALQSAENGRGQAARRRGSAPEAARVEIQKKHFRHLGQNLQARHDLPLKRQGADTSDRSKIRHFPESRIHPPEDRNLRIIFTNNPRPRLSPHRTGRLRPVRCYAVGLMCAFGIQRRLRVAAAFRRNTAPEARLHFPVGEVPFRSLAHTSYPCAALLRRTYEQYRKR